MEYRYVAAQVFQKNTKGRTKDLLIYLTFNIVAYN